MRKYSFADINQDVLNQRWNKHKRSLRRSDTARKKQERMHDADHSGYMQTPYYVKREIRISHCEPVFFPERAIPRMHIVRNAETGEPELQTDKIIIVPAYWGKRCKSSEIIIIKPYLKQYSRTSARATYKHLAVRKERHADYDEAPSTHSYYKRVAEVDWLAW